MGCCISMCCSELIASDDHGLLPSECSAGNLQVKAEKTVSSSIVLYLDISQNVSRATDLLATNCEERLLPISSYYNSIAKDPSVDVCMVSTHQR